MSLRAQRSNLLLSGHEDCFVVSLLAMTCSIRRSAPSSRSQALPGNAYREAWPPYLGPAQNPFSMRAGVDHRVARFFQTGIAPQ